MGIKINGTEKNQEQTQDGEGGREKNGDEREQEIE